MRRLLLQFFNHVLLDKNASLPCRRATERLLRVSVYHHTVPKSETPFIEFFSFPLKDHGDGLTALWLSTVVEVDLDWSHCRFTESLLTYRNEYRGSGGEDLPPLCAFFEDVDAVPFTPASLKEMRGEMMSSMALAQSFLSYLTL